MGGEALKRLYSDVRGVTAPMRGVTAHDVEGGFVAAGSEALAAAGITDRMMDGLGCSWDETRERKGTSRSPHVRIFLNRLLGCSLNEQRLLFDYFASTMEAVVKKLKADGDFEDGMVALINFEGITVARTYPRHLHTDTMSGAATTLIKIKLDRGVSYQSALGTGIPHRFCRASPQRPRQGHVRFWVLAAQERKLLEAGQAKDIDGNRAIQW
jgi:hypothetical protein